MRTSQTSIRTPTRAWRRSSSTGRPASRSRKSTARPRGEGRCSPNPTEELKG